MRVLLVNQFYPPDVAATGQLLADLAEALVARGHEVHVLCSQRAYGGGDAHYPAEQTMAGVQVHRVGGTGFGRRTVIGRLVDYAGFYLLSAQRALALPRMDACLCLTTPPFIGLIGLMLARLRGTRPLLWSMDLYPEVLAACGGMRSGSLLYRLLARLARALYRRCERIVSIGDVMTRRLVAAGARPETVVTVSHWVPGEQVYPVEPDAASDLRRSWGLDGSPVLMYSGNLGAGHELDTAVRAVAGLETCEPLTLLFVGNGRARGRTERLAAELRTPRVHFRPPQPLDRLSESLAAGDVHLVSQREGTQGVLVPSKLYGILAAGRAILFVGPEDCEAAQTVRSAGAGLVVAPADVAGLQAAIRRLLSDAEGREAMGRRGAEYYRSHLGRHRSARAIVALLETPPAPRRIGALASPSGAVELPEACSKGVDA